MFVGNAGYTLSKIYNLSNLTSCFQKKSESSVLGRRQKQTSQGMSYFTVVPARTSVSLDLDCFFFPLNGTHFSHQ